VPSLGEGGMSPRKELVDVLRRRVAGEEDRLSMLIELEHLRSGLGEGRGEEMLRCRSARGDLTDGEGWRGVLEASFIERRLSECERAAACELLLVLMSLVFVLPEAADWACFADILAFTGTRLSQQMVFAMNSRMLIQGCIMLMFATCC
jgi:hypothetical protein